MSVTCRSPTKFRTGGSLTTTRLFRQR